ncbi:MAG: LuxR family transcriptional regulator [Clostridiales bacterium]|nr:LuxR family transcriptional regulator [Clostridiales bacterium]
MKKSKILKRDRVNRALMSIFEYPLTIVEAPMGYGKTTAVREFLAASGVPVLWTSFYSDSDSTDAFWERVTAEVVDLNETAGKRLKSIGTPSDTSHLRALISLMNDPDYIPDTTLVVDDAHHAKGILRTELFGRFIAKLPDDFHIVLLTRDTSFLNLAELSAKGLCNILSQKTLCFTDEELSAYSALMDFHQGEDALKKVSKYTGGWISLAYLILLGLEQGIPMGQSSAINELVENILYNAYDKTIQRFLLRLSVMDTFTEEQARYVTEERRAGEILKKLRQGNAFVFYDEVKGVYRIHPVLLDFLRARQADHVEVSLLYRRVGEWFLGKKAFKLAYTYLCRAGETERVLSLLDEEDSITKDSSDFEGAPEMFATTPRELLFQYPFAYLQYITALLLLSGDPATKRDTVSRLNELEEHYEQIAGLHPNRRNRVLAEISVVRVFTVFNDAHQMLDYTNKALRLLDGGVSCLVKRDAEFTFSSPHFLYTYYREPGSLRETAEFIAAEFPAFSRLSSGCGAGCDYVTLAEYALETGDWQAAELNAFKAIYKAQAMGQTGIILCAGLTLIRLYIYQGKMNEAMEHLWQLRANLSEEDNVVYNTTLDLIEGYAYGCMSRSDNIPEWLRTSNISLVNFMYQSMAFNHIVSGKAVLLAKDYIRLEMLTETSPQYFGIFHNQLGFLHNHILATLAKYRLYGMEKGCAKLAEAIDMGRADHLILPFAEYAPELIDMLRHITQNNSRDDYIMELLEACEHYMESLKRASETAVTITERELEVLTLAAEGLTRDEIAARLYISGATVKTHLENIYRKLEVNGKTAAIKKAEKLKIL